MNSMDSPLNDYYSTLFWNNDTSVYDRRWEK